MNRMARYLADLHIHSRYARACSKDLTVPTIDLWAQKKGIKLIGTGDFTHPYWFGELSQELEPAPEDGLFILRGAELDSATRWLLSVEVSSIFNQDGKGRRVHTLVILPSFESAKDFNERLGRRGKLASDGRPTLGLSVKEVAKAALAAHPKALVIPAHAWTPWFGILGSQSGFDSLEQCFEELTPDILAIETGLSSDPPMNWRVGFLDDFALVSFSDAHSPKKLGRELTEFDGQLSYPAIYEGIRASAPSRIKQSATAKISRTIEFFPEEGKYHLDGHRVCQVRWTPKETKAHDGICPVCKRPVTIGVMARVEELADRPEGFKPDGTPDFTSLVPLEEIIAEAVNQNTGTKAVTEHYERLVQAFKTEMAVLEAAAIDDISQASSPAVAVAIRRVRNGNLNVEAGYDGEFGTVKIFEKDEREQFSSNPQASLF